MSQFPIVVIGGSAGAVQALRHIMAGLPQTLEAAIFAVVHLPPERISGLTTVFNRASALPVSTATDLAPIQPRRVYIAPPDRHLLLEKGQMRVTRGPHENRTRPAIDPLFRTAADSYGKAVIGVLLSGLLDDGVAGLFKVKLKGGVTIVQDPADAPYASIPLTALREVRVDYCASLQQIANLITTLVCRGTANVDGQLAAALRLNQWHLRHDGTASVLQRVCPVCLAELFKAPTLELVRYRCRAGHAFPLNWPVEPSDVDRLLWSAIRALLARSSSHKKSANEERARGRLRLAEREEALAKQDATDARELKRILLYRAANPVQLEDGRGVSR